MKKIKQKSIASELLSLSALQITCAGERERNYHAFNPLPSILRQLWASRNGGEPQRAQPDRNLKQKKHSSPLYGVSKRHLAQFHIEAFTPLHYACGDSRRHFLLQVTIQGFHSRKPGALSRGVVLMSTRLESLALLKLLRFMQSF